MLRPLWNFKSKGKVPEASQHETQSVRLTARLTEFQSVTHSVTLVELLRPRPVRVSTDEF